MANDKNSKIHDRLLIINKLSILLENKCPIKARLGKNDSLLTYIMEINVKDGILILSYGDSDEMNKKITSMPYIEFNAIFRSIFVTFTGGTVKKITYKGNPVFLMYIPSVLHWCNRRQHNRMKIPMDGSSFCEIVLSNPAQDTNEEYRQNYVIATTKIRNKLLEKLKLEQEKPPHMRQKQEILINLIQLGLYDVSQAGCSVLNDDETYSYFLTPDTVYENCRIVMPNNNEITTSFKIVSKRHFKPSANDEDLTEFKELVGIKFLKIER